MKSDGLARPLSHQSFEQDAESANSQLRPSGAGESAARCEAQPVSRFARVPSLQTQAELCILRFDERVRELAVLLASAEALGRTAAQKLEPPRTPQRQFAGLATTFAMTARCGAPLPGGFEPIKNLRHQMAASPASATTFSTEVKLLASKSSQARIFRHDS